MRTSQGEQRRLKETHSTYRLPPPPLDSKADFSRCQVRVENGQNWYLDARTAVDIYLYFKIYMYVLSVHMLSELVALQQEPAVVIFLMVVLQG